MITLILVAGYFWMGGMTAEYVYSAGKLLGRADAGMSALLIGLLWPVALFYWGIGARR